MFTDHVLGVAPVSTDVVMCCHNVHVSTPCTISQPRSVNDDIAELLYLEPTGYSAQFHDSAHLVAHVHNHDPTTDLCNSAFTIHLAAKASVQHRQSSHLRPISDQRHTVSLTQLARQHGNLLPREHYEVRQPCCAAQRCASMSAMNAQPDAQWSLPRIT